ncbi:hypothetical protein GCM10011349_20070 [Novosphingobium indicum]|uniref:Uncharacterized protein n=1 Tax=Novosphingobium indicum TaxID=462949 RepID=A0ABQ2JL41_9SPHN|nr:hypothetical protein [Novosphingobium indicum]GGN49448.1 hypothetical protein GCM10011349_20070 [Novosphingobium indicum]
MAKIEATIRYRFTVRARLMLWACKAAARLGIPIDLDAAGKAIVSKMRLEVR